MVSKIVFNQWYKYYVLRFDVTEFPDTFQCQDKCVLQPYKCQVMSKSICAQRNLTELLTAN